MISVRLLVKSLWLCVITKPREEAGNWDEVGQNLFELMYLVLFLVLQLVTWVNWLPIHLIWDVLNEFVSGFMVWRQLFKTFKLGDID